MKNIAVIYDADPDGTMCAAIIKNHFPNDKITFFETRSYDKTKHAEIMGEVIVKDGEYVFPFYSHLYMCDISFSQEYMAMLWEIYEASFYWFDHHASVSHIFDTINGAQELGVAACTLVWDFLNGDDRPLAVEYISDYDVFHGEGTDTFHSVVIPFHIVMNRLRHIDLYERAMEDLTLVKNLLYVGHELWHIEQVEFENDLPVKYIDHKGVNLAITYNQPNVGRIAYLERKSGSEADFLINVNEKDHGWSYSIRSIADDADCLDFIQGERLKGGGHPKAAGFFSPINIFQ